MSINLELPTAEGLRQLAPHKTRKSILNPLRQIQDGIAESHAYIGMSGGNKGAYWYTQQRVEGNYEEFKGGIQQVTADREKRLQYTDEWLEDGASTFDNKPGRKEHKEIRNEQNNNEIQNEQNNYEIAPGRIRTGFMQKKKSAIILDQNMPRRDMLSQSLTSQTYGQSMPDPMMYGQGMHGLYSHNNHKLFHNQITQSPQNKLKLKNDIAGNRGFVPAGQSTQMIIGATPESDYQIISVAEALYQRFDLKRVFYSAFVRVNDDSLLPVLPGGPPLLREHRLYQADFLLRFYGFAAKELLSEQRPNFNVLIDPKCNWALGHLELFPVEIERADYYSLLRVPGIGPKSAKRIVKARKTARLNYQDLKKMGVVLKRAMYFLTCNGKMFYETKMNEDFITAQLIGAEEKSAKQIVAAGMQFQQLSLFDMTGNTKLMKG